MTITLELPPQEEARILQRAQMLGVTTQEYVRDLLSRVLASEDQAFDVNKALRPVSEEQKERIRAMFKTFEEGDADEQRETLDYLKRALDEDRLSDRPLFPSEQP